MGMRLAIHYTNIGMKLGIHYTNMYWQKQAQVGTANCKVDLGMTSRHKMSHRGKFAAGNWLGMSCSGTVKQQ